MPLISHRKHAMLLAACAFLAGAFSAGSRAARADDLLVMPYSCKIAGGKPVLRPSADQTGHAVIGRREEKTFRACSPVNPELCHRWTVHRFDLDCDGRRVPWVEVAAAAEAARGEGVFLSGDGLEVEMPPQWSLPPGAPCGRYQEGDARRDGNFERFCERRLARIERISVAMPRGFAPMFDIDGIFVANTAPRVAEAEPQPPAPAAKAEPRRKAEPERARAETETKQTAAVPQPVPAPTAVPTPTPTPAVKASPETKSETKPEAKVADVPAKSSPPAAVATGPIIPVIINGESPAPSQASPSQSSPSQPSPETVAGELPPDASPPAASPSPSGDVPAANAEPGVETGSVGALAIAGRPLALNATHFAFATFAVLSLLTLILLWRRGRASSAAGLSRDIAAVSLDGTAEPAERTPMLSGLPVVAPPASTREVAPSPQKPPNRLVSAGDAIPLTREEALGVLGMGVGPEASEAAIKKIVDGLRASWHPDHAHDAPDRATREARLKQINAAWDILSGRATG